MLLFISSKRESELISSISAQIFRLSSKAREVLAGVPSEGSISCTGHSCSSRDATYRNAPSYLDTILSTTQADQFYGSQSSLFGRRGCRGFALSARHRVRQVPVRPTGKLCSCIGAQIGRRDS